MLSIKHFPIYSANINLDNSYRSAVRRFYGTEFGVYFSPSWRLWNTSGLSLIAAYGTDCRSAAYADIQIIIATFRIEVCDLGTFCTGHLKNDTKVSEGNNLLVRVVSKYSPYRVDTEF